MKRFARVLACAAWITVPCAFAAQNPAAPRPSVEIQQRWKDASLPEVRAAAQSGNPQAQYYLGCIHAEGKKIPADISTAIEWYRRAAEQGLAEAQHRLGWMYDHGQGVPQDSTEAVRWMLLAAEQGFAPAQLELGGIYEDRKQNFILAAEWYARAADQGNMVAQSRLGDLNFYGKIGHHHPEAVKWYRKAAEQGHVLSMRRLGQVYRYNRPDLPGDPAQAIAWFKKAAALGDAEAALELNQMLENGEDTPQTPNQPPRQAGKPQTITDRVAEAERYAQDYPYNNTPEALYQLGWMHENGQGRPKDLDKAGEFYRESVSRGYGKFRLQAYEAALRLFASGQGLPKTKGELQTWILRNYIEGSSAQVQFHLGEIFYHGFGVDQDMGNAATWFSQAAMRGSPEAQLRVGQLWASDTIGSPDRAEAARWYRLAALRGIAQAQYFLGLCYAKGEGVGQDDVLALKWLRLAASQSFPDALTQCQALEKRLSPAQIAEANRQVASFAARRPL